MGHRVSGWVGWRSGQLGGDFVVGVWLSEAGYV